MGSTVYTKDQLDAIEEIDLKTNLQLIACAGSGKTDVVSARIANILKSVPNITPSNIVAFTYTEKAAEELKNRIYKHVKDSVGEITGMAEMFVGTIHSFCLRMLQDYTLEYQKFSVLDEVKTKIFIDKNFESIGMKNLGLERYKDTDFFISLMSILRENEIENEKLPENFQKALDDYDKCFESHNYFDFTMIMERTIRHIQEDEVLKKKMKERFKYITVDEYQDVNPIQEKLIRIFYDFGANICVVGDDDQTIYQWRGSEIRNILDFQNRYQNVKPVFLLDNFRSSIGIVEIAHSVIELNLQRKEKEMRPKGKQVFEEGDIVYKEFTEPKEEYRFIADRILELQKAGVSLSEIVILLRVKRLGAQLIEILDEKKIRFIVEGVNELFDTPEVQASKAIFDYLNETLDVESLKQSWLSITDYHFKEENVIKAVKSLEKCRPHNHPFYYTFVLQDIFQNFIDLLQVKEAVEADNKDLEIILYNLGKFSQVIDDFETIHFKTSAKNRIRNFCNFLHYTADEYYPEGHLQNRYISPDAVRIMTIHQAKGLQFTSVFIPGMSRNIFPPKRPGGKSVWKTIPKDLIKNPERFEASRIEDERRLLYVAITRAKKFLFITRAVYNQKMNKMPSELFDRIKQPKYIFEYNPSLDYTQRKLPLDEKKETPILLNFSVLKDYYACPYRFKLNFFYGFVQPLGQRMGYGRSLHNIVMEIHRRAIENEDISKGSLPEIISRHFSLPYSTSPVLEEMRKKADESISTYFDKNLSEFKNITLAEKDIEIDFGNGVRVNGRIDLVKRKDLDGKDKTYIIDFKTVERLPFENISEEQLRIYAIGYRSLCGQKPDFIEIYNIDENKTDHRKQIVDSDLEETRKLIYASADNIKKNILSKKCSLENCTTCYKSHLCLSTEKRKELGVK